MPVFIKSRKLSLLTKVERRPTGVSCVVAAMAGFDLADPACLDSEQALWMMLAEALPPGAVIDACMPKPRAELLIGGRLNLPETPALLLEAEVAGLSRRLAVFGDRWWVNTAGGYAATAPRPIGDMLLGHDRAYGGPGYAANPSGRGHDAVGLMAQGSPVALPNIEPAEHLLNAIEDMPPPARFAPLDMLAPERRALAGTYDAAWAQTRAPGLPDDVHPDYFMMAPQEQRLPDYLRGDEPYRLRNFASGHGEISGHLPGIRPRVFVGRDERSWVELSMRLDTLWLFAGARRGVLVWHGVTRVSDIEGRDVSDVLLAYERMGDEPRPMSHYAEVRRLRLDPEQASRHAFSESQLSPPRDPEEAARRLAARRALAEARAQRLADANAFMTERALAEAGLPKAFAHPPRPASADLLLLPTPQDLEEGDFDLAALLDQMEEKRRQVEAEIAPLVAAGAAVSQASARLQAPGAGGADVDALLDAMMPLSGVDMAQQLDGSLGKLSAPPDLPDDRASLPEMDTAQAELAKLADWRAAILDGLQPEDDDALLDAAYGRFIGRADARPLAAARDAISSLEDLPAISEPEEASLPEAAPAPVASPIAAMLDGIAATPDLPPGTAASITDAFGAADRQIAAALPGLAPVAGGTVIDSLLAAFEGAGGGAPAPASANAALADIKAGVPDTLAQIDEAEARLLAGVADLRLAAPEPLYPERPLSLRLAKKFGDLVLEDVRAGVDLRGRDLAGVDLAGADLSGCDLSGAFLERANLARTKLVGACLAQATLAGARITHADLSGADLTGANLSQVDGAGANLSDTRLADARLFKVHLAGASLRGAQMSQNTLMEGDLEGADLSGAMLDGLTFIKTSLRRAVFDQATLRQCQILQVDLTEARMARAFVDRCAFISPIAPGLMAGEADLRGSSFIGEANLAGADLSGVLASDCSFYGADLTGARFTRAILDRAVLAQGKLAGADLRLASLRQTLLDGADLTGADLAGAQALECRLHRALLSHALMRGANLYGADLLDADLTGIDLTGANLVKTILAMETRHD
ncbi:DUF2169 domain-containing protein [Xanthobacteraceae bacterium A53D]